MTGYMLVFSTPPCSTSNRYILTCISRYNTLHIKVLYDGGELKCRYSIDTQKFHICEAKIILVLN